MADKLLTDQLPSPIPLWRRLGSYVLSLVMGFSVAHYTRGEHAYVAEKSWGGYEPAETQFGAIQILESGTTEMDFHTTGFPYLIALVYLVFPHVPLSVLIVQIACIPLVVWCVGRIAREMGGPAAEEFGLWLAATYYPFGYFAGVFNSVFVTFLFITLSITWLLPLLRGPQSVWRSMAVGLALGIAVCQRPNFSCMGVAFALSLWIYTRSFWEAFLRSLPIAVVSIGMLVTMTIFNPPAPGNLLRGDQGFYRSVLEGLYQYSDSWWDWEWFGDNPDDPGYQEYLAHLHKIEVETGKNVFIGADPTAAGYDDFAAHVHKIEAVTGTTIKLPMKEGQASVKDPELQAGLKREALGLMRERPWLLAKKLAISTVRVWIFTPTHLKSMSIKVAIAVQEFVYLALAIYGLWVAKRRGRYFWLAVGVLFVTTMWSWTWHVEARYSLPGRGMEIALVAVGVQVIWAKCRRRSKDLSPVGQAA